MELRLYNTWSREKEVFTPLAPGRVGMYTCGPTVYADAHIGNLRSYLFPDVLKRLLRHLGYQVTHVINITDVGHLTSDADTGADKLESAAAKAGKSAWDLARLYTQRYLDDLDRLHILRPEVMPTATSHVAEQIALIAELEAKGFTYRTEDGVYFDTGRFPAYGHLARLDVAGLREGTRVDMGAKQQKTDFALWKFSPVDEKRQMEWDSPWGKGFPGWHIECSAMSMKYLGQTFDIHTGGKDHIPVHHSNEIAQSEAATGKPFVKYWLHGEFLVLGEDQRMGKSEGNFLRLQSLVDQGYEPLAYRYLAAGSHYRKFLQFTWEALSAADNALLGLRRLLQEAVAAGANTALADMMAANTAESSTAGANTSAGQALLADLCDDLNTPKALATLWTTLKDPGVTPADKVALGRLAEELLALGLFDFSRLAAKSSDATQDAPEEVQALARERWAARGAKNWAESDRLRDALAQLGWVVKDGKDAYTLEKK